MNENPILVTNGTGKTGRRVAERLRAAGRSVRVGSRASDPAFDWENRATWAPALEGTSAAYVSFFPDLAVEGAPEAIAAFAHDARAAGVDRLVLLSGRGEDEAQRAEAALQASGADWTIVRCSWFAQNFSEGLFRELIVAGSPSRRRSTSSRSPRTGRRASCRSSSSSSRRPSQKSSRAS